MDNNIINLDRSDLCYAYRDIPLKDIEHYHFSSRRMSTDAFNYADRVVFFDKDGQHKVLKDKYAK